MTDDSRQLDDDRPLSEYVPPRPIQASASPEALVDAWPRATPFPLGGWLERNGFAPIWTALLVLILGFILFQLVANTIAIVAIIPTILEAGAESMSSEETMELALGAIGDNIDMVLLGNTAGQLIGFGLFALLLARLHSSRPGAFLRIRTPDWPAFALAAVGWVAMVPAIQWLGRLNSMLPQPEFLEQLEASQVQLIEGALTDPALSTWFLFAMLALTPTICEELIFRGYLQRQVERKWGAMTSIVLVGVVFGLYHLRLTQVVPLSLLGIWMGYVVWASGSLWTGMLVHVLNNGFAVMVAAYVREDPDLDMAAVEQMVVPWYLGVAGLIAVAGIGMLMWKRRQAVVGTTPDAQPVSAPPTLPSPVPALS